MWPLGDCFEIKFGMVDPHLSLPPCRGKEKKSLVKAFGVVGLLGHKTATTPSAARPPLLENKEGRVAWLGVVCGMCGSPDGDSKKAIKQNVG